MNDFKDQTTARHLSAHLSGPPAATAVQRPTGRGPGFDQPLQPGGYAWWYIDGVSDDGSHAVTAIAFVGSVFSPWYYRARQHGPADPLRFAAINVAVRTPRGALWVMNERAIDPGDRGRQHLQLGSGTQLWWRGDHLRLELRERTKPFFQRMPGELRGTLDLTPLALHGAEASLDAAGRHRWCCVAPQARFALTLQAPELRFSGHAYHDANWGDEGLERAFAGWHWSRAQLGDATAVIYDTCDPQGRRQVIQRMFHRDGRSADLPELPTAALPGGRWGVRRQTRSDSGRAELATTLEDSPFYVRSLVRAAWLGQPALAVHESLDLRRFAAPWVRALLPWRSRREQPNAARRPELALEAR